MLAGQPIIAFVTTTNAEIARPFYEETLGLKVTDVGPHAIVFDAGGVMLRMALTKKIEPAPYTVLGWAVTDIKATIAGLTARGVEFEDYDWFEQDEQQVWTSPDGSKIAWFKDPDGNLLSLTQFATR